MRDISRIARVNRKRLQTFRRLQDFMAEASAVSPWRYSGVAVYTARTCRYSFCRKIKFPITCFQPYKILSDSNGSLSNPTDLSELFSFVNLKNDDNSSTYYRMMMETMLIVKLNNVQSVKMMYVLYVKKNFLSKNCLLLIVG
jgi:hypothetical protein